MRLLDKVTGPHVGERTDRPGTWRARWRVNGAPHSRDFPSETTAQDFAADLRRAVRNGANWDYRSGLPATALKGDALLHEWVRTYLADRWDSLTPNSRRTDAWTLTYMVERATGPLDQCGRRTLLEWLIGTHDLPASLSRWARGVPTLRELDRAALYQLEAAMRRGVGGQELKGRLASRQVATMRRCLNEAVRRGEAAMFDWPPAERASRTKKAKARQTPITRTVMSLADAAALLSALAGSYRTMTAIALYAGLRPGEVVALEGGDVDLEHRLLHIRRAWNGSGAAWGDEDEDLGATKTCVERVVPLTDAIMAELGDLPEGPLFRTASGHRPTQSNWRRALQGAAKRAGVVAPTPYECRHFFVSHLVRRVPIATAARLAGHSPEVLVKHYLHEVEGPAPDISTLFASGESA